MAFASLAILAQDLDTYFVEIDLPYYNSTVTLVARTLVSAASPLMATQSEASREIRRNRTEPCEPSPRMRISSYVLGYLS